MQIFWHANCFGYFLENWVTFLIVWSPWTSNSSYCISIKSNYWIINKCWQNLALCGRFCETYHPKIRSGITNSKACYRQPFSATSNVLAFYKGRFVVPWRKRRLPIRLLADYVGTSMVAKKFYNVGHRGRHSIDMSLILLAFIDYIFNRVKNWVLSQFVNLLFCRPLKQIIVKQHAFLNYMTEGATEKVRKFSNPIKTHLHVRFQRPISH